MMDLAIIGGVVIAVVLAIILFFSQSYTVVPPNEAHVVVSGKKGRKVYCTREGGEYDGSAYYKFPIIQKRSIVSLENIELYVDNVPLRDMNMAKFQGDVVSWLNVKKPLLASERFGNVRSLKDIEKDIYNIIKAVTRNESMGSTIIDIIKNRKEFSERVESAVNKELQEWGMQVIELEVIHFLDVADSSGNSYAVVENLERRQATIIDTETRKTVAAKEKEANIVESNSTKETALVVAKNEEDARRRQIEKDEQIATREQEKDIKVAQKTKEANIATVEANRKLTVGNAEVTKEAAIVKADGEAQAAIKTGEASAKVEQMTGEAQANVTRAKGLAEAVATEKKAEALKKYEEAGIGIEVINASKAVQLQKWVSWAEAMKAAKINVFSGGSDGSNMLGVDIGTKAGFDLGAMAQVASDMGISLPELLQKVVDKTNVNVNQQDVSVSARKTKKE